MKQIQPQEKLAIEAEVFQKLIEHLQKHPEVQNIDIMNLAYFCRNCLSKWYKNAAQKRGIELDYDEVKEIIYGMHATEYKANYQKKASQEQLEAFEVSKTKASD